MGQLVCAQLNDFDLSLSVIDESCAGNGSISINVSGTTEGASMIYNLFLFPDLSTPIAQTSANSFSNLESGDYRVEAIQTLGELQNSQTADATVNSVFSVLDFDIEQDLSGECATTNLVITTLSGTPQFYEIISGPVTVPLQEDNIFNNLPDGTYVIRVFDDCGNALTKTYTLVSSAASFSVSAIQLPTLLDSCEATTLSYSIIAESGVTLSYPISVEYSTSLLDGSASNNFANTYDSGPDDALEITETIANFDDQPFEIEITVQDDCGNVAVLTEVIDPNPEVTLTSVPAVCNNNLTINVANVLPPYTLEFIEAPAAFDPSDYNDNEGVYTEPTIVFEEEETGLPSGVYSVVVVDSCGRSDEAIIDLVEEPVEPLISSNNRGCDPLRGEFTFSIPGREIISAVFMEAPEDYENDLPDDISSFISSSGSILTVSDLLKGSYVLEVVDNCGTIYLEDIIIPELEDLPLNVSTSPNCTSDTGSLRIGGSYGTVVSVVIIDAPSAFSSALPFDYSDAILSSGIFYVDDLPTGNYTVQFTDSCGNVFTFDETIESYTSDPSIYLLQKNCGSFDLGIFDTDNSVTNQSYWFQKYYADSNSWGHPGTGVLYTEGELPNDANSITIQNGETILNNFFIGTFRLIKTFQSFNEPNADAFCLDIFGEFDIGSDLVINNVFNLNCEGGSGPSDIFVDVTGIPPYNFSIISPIFIDNGEDNVFTGLDPGIYEIRVEDACGSIEAITINSTDLVPVVTVGTPEDLVICSETSANQAIFDLSQQNSDLLGIQNPENFTITYHLNQNDANSGNNPISENYENISNPQTIFARIINNTIDICYKTTSFDLTVGLTPELGLDETITICDDDFILLSADSGYSSYLWSTGQSTRDIIVNTAGVYSVIVSNDYGDFLCSATKTFTVNASGVAVIESIRTEDFTFNNNSIAIEVSGLGDYEYSLDGIIYQPETFFTDLSTGDYTIFIRDRNGCGVITASISLLDYKRFFTPNGDGENEFWQISGSQFEPELKVSVYDRYGKLLTAFTGDQRGWDGNYNGKRMPTNDYWFVVERKNGKRHIGHFTLKR